MEVETNKQRIHAYAFTAKTHQNVTATHKSTLAFTRETEISKRGNCFVGVAADFNFTPELIENIQTSKTLVLEMECDGFRETVAGEGHAGITLTEDDIVVRKSGDYVDSRTLMIKADKAARDLDRTFVEKLKRPNAVIKVRLLEHGEAHV